MTLNHYNRYCKILQTLQTIISDELETSPDPPNMLQYIEMIKVLTHAIDDINKLKDDLKWIKNDV